MSRHKSRQPAQALWDPLAAFFALSPEDQQRAAAAAMILGFSQTAGDALPGAECAALDALVALVGSRALPVPDLSILGVRFCHGCGCTDDFACTPVCHWAAEGLCSCCARSSPPRPAARRAPEWEAT